MAGAPEVARQDEALAGGNQLSLALLRGLLIVFVVSLVPVWLAVDGARERYVLSGVLVRMMMLGGLPVVTGRPAGKVRAWMVITPAVAMSLIGYAFAGFL